MTAMAAPREAPDLREPKGWRRSKNRIMTVLMVIALVLTIIPLGFVLFTVIAKGASIISWSFVTSGPIPSNVAPAGEGGIGPAMLGTIEITALATLMAVPLGVLGAVYLNEYGGKGRLARLIGFMADVMTGVPSIVMGLFIFSIWVLHFGYSGLAGAFALGCLMLPVVIRSSDEMLKLVPDPLREASYALGATKSRVTLTVVLPAAIGGHRQRRAAGRRPGRGRDGAAAVHHPHRDHREPERVQRRQHLAALADLLERVIAVHRRAGPRLGRGAHPHRHCLYPHDRRPDRHRPLHPVFALGISWNSLNRTSSPRPRPDQLPKPARPAARGRRTRSDTPGASVFDTQNVSMLLRLLPGRNGCLADHPRERDHRVHRPVRAAARRRCCGR